MRARSYEDTSTIEIGGVQFQLGWIPAGLFDLFDLELDKARNAARRRALLELKADGELPDDEVAREAAVVGAMAVDPAFIEALQGYYEDLAAWAVRGHTGLDFDTEKPVPFESASRDYRGRTFPGASDATVKRYGDTPGLLYRLAGLIRDRERLGPVQKKSSPSPPDMSIADSTASTASPPPNSKS